MKLEQFIRPLEWKPVVGFNGKVRKWEAKVHDGVYCVYTSTVRAFKFRVPKYREYDDCDIDIFKTLEEAVNFCENNNVRYIMDILPKILYMPEEALGN